MSRPLSQGLSPAHLSGCRPCRLFVSSRNPARAISKNAISYFLQEVIAGSGSISESGVVPHAHSIRGVVTSTAFK